MLYAEFGTWLPIAMSGYSGAAFPLYGQAVTEAGTVRGDIATNYEMRVQLSRKLTNTENVLRT